MGEIFNKTPLVRVKGKEHDCYPGWNLIGSHLREKLPKGKGRKIISIETYQGVYLEDLRSQISKILEPDILIDTGTCLKSEREIRNLTQPDVTDDRVFGFLTRLNMAELFDSKKLQEAISLIEESGDALIVIIGYGTVLLHNEPDMLIYADMARWEIQQRMRRNEVDNLGIRNREEPLGMKYRRAYFVDWRICDRVKKETMHRWDYVLDTNQKEHPKLAPGEAVREGLRQTAGRPFSVVPFFDPGPWGGPVDEREIRTG